MGFPTARSGELEEQKVALKLQPMDCSDRSLSTDDSPPTPSGTGNTPRQPTSTRRAAALGGPRSKPQIDDVVALTADIPWQNLWKGQVGVVVDLRESDQLEIEFRDCSDGGDTFQNLAIPTADLMVLHFHQHQGYC